jgi:hypothetical protein
VKYRTQAKRQEKARKGEGSHRSRCPHTSHLIAQRNGADRGVLCTDCLHSPGWACFGIYPFFIAWIIGQKQHLLQTIFFLRVILPLNLEAGRVINLQVALALLPRVGTVFYDEGNHKFQFKEAFDPSGAASAVFMDEVNLDGRTMIIFLSSLSFFFFAKKFFLTLKGGERW